MHTKKAQLTLFIVVGVVLLLSFLLVAIVGQQSFSVENPSAFTEQASGRQFVESCLQSSTDDAFDLLGKQGFYYTAPRPAEFVVSYVYNPFAKSDLIEQLEVSVPPYYFISNKSYLPALGLIEHQVSELTADNLKVCLDDQKDALSLEYDNLSVEAQIEPKSVVLTLNSSVRVQKVDKITHLDEFEYNYPKDMFSKYKLVQDFISEQQVNPRYLPLGYLTNLAYRNNFTFSTESPKDNVILYRLVFPDGFVWAFLVRYDWARNQTPTAQNLSLVHLYGNLGYHFFYKVPMPEDSGCISTSPRFILKNCSLDFTPTLSDVGIHQFLIRISRSTNKSTYLRVILNITNENQPPTVADIPDMQAGLGVPFVYKVLAKSSDHLFYYDNCDQFNINILTGLINFTPENIGYYLVNITVVDTHSNVIVRNFHLRVRNEI